jgi:hypothetical protein
VSGLAALLQSAQPVWSPAAVRSGLMTMAPQPTLASYPGGGSPLLDTAMGGTTTSFDYGVARGHIDPVRLLDPGLVYELGTRDYVDFPCAIRYSSTVIDCRRGAESTRVPRTRPTRAASTTRPSRWPTRRRRDSTTDAHEDAESLTNVRGRDWHVQGVDIFARRRQPSAWPLS